MKTICSLDPSSADDKDDLPDKPPQPKPDPIPVPPGEEPPEPIYLPPEPPIDKGEEEPKIIVSADKSPGYARFQRAGVRREYLNRSVFSPHACTLEACVPRAKSEAYS